MRGADAELIRGCKKGQARAWDRLVRKYERLVFSIPRSYGLSPADAADVSQLTFTILIQSLDSLTEESNVKAWLATVARRHTWRLMEKGRREGLGREDDLADTPWLLGSEKPSERWETIDWLDGGLTKMGEPCRGLLTALYLDASEPTYAEISRRLDMPVGSSGPTRARCLRRLRTALGTVDAPPDVLCRPCFSLPSSHSFDDGYGDTNAGGILYGRYTTVSRERIDLETLADWAEGRLPDKEALAVEERLVGADEATRAEVEWLRQFVSAETSSSKARPKASGPSWRRPSRPTPKVAGGRGL